MEDRLLRAWYDCGIQLRSAEWLRSGPVGAGVHLYRLLGTWQGMIELSSYKYRCRVEAGQACLLSGAYAAGVDCRLPAGEPALSASFVVVASGPGGDPLASLPLPTVLPMDDPAHWRRRATAAVELLHSSRPILEARILARPLLDDLVARYLLAGVTGDAFVDATLRPVPEWVQAAHQLLLERCTEPNLDLADVAAVVGISTSRFLHGYKEHHGVSPGVQLRRLRLRMAERLLRSNGEYTIADVAERCGFVNAAAFAACFRRHRGMSPSAWRRGGG